MTGRSKKSKSEAVDREAERKTRAIDWLKQFDGVVWHYEGGYVAKIQIAEAAAGRSDGQPEGIEYSFTFHEPGVGGGIGKRIYGLDNAHSPDKEVPWDHEHKTVWPKEPPGARPRESPGTRLAEPSLLRAFELFPKGIADVLNRLALPNHAVGESRLEQRGVGTSEKARANKRDKPSKGARK